MSDPTGRRALFGPPLHGADVPAFVDGRRALFSSRRRSRGSVVVECSRCRARTPLSPVQLVGRLVPSLWIPGLPFSRLLRCSACQSLAWCKVHWRTLVS